MPISFPASPTTNQTYTYGTRTYRWTGTAWEFVSSSGSGLTWSSVPASATATGVAGSIAYDGDFLYVAVGSNQWERAALSTWALDTYFRNVTLLLHADGSGSTFTDSSATPNTITANGDVTQIATQSKFGGKSAYFDGSGDSLNTGATANTLLGQSGNFTVEMWIYPTSLSGTRALFSTRTNSSGNDVIIFGIRSSSIYIDTNAVGVVSEGATLTVNAWQHVAMTRSGNTFTTYINGTVVATGSGSHLNWAGPAHCC